jgi:hypothetical protein
LGHENKNFNLSQRIWQYLKGKNFIEILNSSYNVCLPHKKRNLEVELSHFYFFPPANEIGNYNIESA